MENFFPNQLYTSSGEPELGIGIVTEVSKGRVQISFPETDEVRLYAIESAPLIRTVFKVGDTVFDKHANSMRIEKIQNQDSLFIYFGEGKSLLESQIGSGTATHTVEDRLFAADIDSPEKFSLRRETLYHDYNRKLSPVFGFVGGKIDLIPHQLYIAHEVSSRFAPRVLLSDQVGLGKTIEACLILHRLLVTGRISRVLIVVPESLMHQWFVEVLRKFNLWFHIFDEERCTSLDESAPDGNPFLDDQLILCSIDFLAQNPKRALQAISADWDMLVVDEAHHLKWSVENASPEYSIVEMLSKIAKGLLLLTATPEQLGVESHFARLRLLDPNRYSDYSDFIDEIQNHKEIATLVEKIYNSEKLNSADKLYLEKFISKEKIEYLKSDEVLRNNLIEDLVDQYGPGRVLFRNTRQAMSGFPKRIADLISIPQNENEPLLIEDLMEEFSNDLNKNSENNLEFDFQNDPRVEWILKKMDEIYPSKILLICSSKEKVLALESVISERIKINVGIFHEDLTLVQRDRNAAWFAEHDSSQILLCSEIGSEGRNFQFAQHLILFDVPFHPELLEQRIGRLDRIGQKDDIHIHIPFVERSPQEILIKWYHEGLNAFESNLEGGNLIFNDFQGKLLNIFQIQDEEKKSTQLKILIEETKNYQQELKLKLADGRDKLLEINSFRPKVAKDLIQQIQSQDKNPDLESYLTQVFQHFDIEMEDLASRTFLLHPSSFASETFPAIPREGIQITFDRKRAISRDDVEFLSWEHPITTAALDKVLSSSFGNASFGILKSNSNPSLLLELIFVLETAGAESIAIDRFLPNTPFRIVLDHSFKDVTNQFTIEFLSRNMYPQSNLELLQNEAIVDNLLPKMIESAKEIIQEKANLEIEKGLKRMIQIVDHEINRLSTLQEKNNNIRPDEIQTAIQEKEVLSNLIKKAKIRLDALQLIQVQ